MLTPRLRFFVFLTATLLLTEKAFASVDDSVLTKQLFQTVIKKDHDQLKRVLDAGANPNALFDNFFLPLSPLTIAIGSDDTTSQKILVAAGARYNAGGSDVLVSLLFNRHHSLEKLFAAGFSEDPDKEFFYVILNSLDPLHWKEFCDTLSQKLETVPLDSIDLFPLYYRMRKQPSDATPKMKARSFVLLMQYQPLDEYMLKELSSSTAVVTELSNSTNFVNTIKQLPLCTKVSLVTDTSFKKIPEIRSILFQSLKEEKGTSNSCYLNLFKYYLPSIVKSGDLRSFHEFECLLPDNLNDFRGAAVQLGFLSSDSITEPHYQMIQALMNRGMPVGRTEESPYFNFSYVSMNRLQTPFRDKLFDLMVAAIGKDTASLDAAYSLTYTEPFIYTLLSKGAHAEKDLKRKLEGLMFYRLPADLMSYILDKCAFMPGIDSVAENISDRSYFEVLKRAILQRTLVNTRIPHYSKEQIDKIKVRKLFDLKNSISFDTKMFIKHYRAGKPTELISNNPIPVPPFKQYGVSSTIAVDTFSYTDDLVFKRSMNIDLGFSAPTFTAQYDQIYYDNRIPLIKKGDKFFYTASSEILIPRVSFDPATELFFPTAEILVLVKDTSAKVQVSQNGKEFTLKPSTFKIIDLTRGDTKISITNMRGWSLSTTVDLHCNLSYDQESYKAFDENISGAFYEKERVAHYAKLYVNSPYSADITRQKNRAVSTNIISSLMYYEKYPAHIAEKLEESAKRIAIIDNNVNKFRQFYVLHKKINAQHILDLQLLFQQINLAEIQDPSLRTGLQNLYQKLKENAQEQEILDNYLEVFTSQYFDDLSYEIQRYQGLVLELAQFMTDEELTREYQRRGLDINTITNKVSSAENKISNNILNGRGSFLKTLISK